MRQPSQSRSTRAVIKRGEGVANLVGSLFNSYRDAEVIGAGWADIFTTNDLRHPSQQISFVSRGWLSEKDREVESPPEIPSQFTKEIEASLREISNFEPGYLGSLLAMGPELDSEWNYESLCAATVK